MSLQGWAWWKWVVVSLIVGALIGWTLTNREPDDPSLPSTTLTSFLNKLRLRTDGGDPVVAKIRVGPLVTDNAGKKVQVVTFWEKLKNRQTGNWDPVRQYRLYTAIPLFPKVPQPNYGIVDYLADAKQQMPGLDAGFSWWQVPRNAWLISMGGSVLVIGVLWPLTIRMMVKLGLGNPEVADDAGYDLSQTRTRPSNAVVVPQGISADAQAQLAALNERLEQHVGDMLIGDEKPDVAKERKAEQAVIRKLSSVPAEQNEPTGQQEKPISFDGEFYPVARPTTKGE